LVFTVELVGFGESPMRMMRPPPQEEVGFE
jgi:hypothetical protein